MLKPKNIVDIIYSKTQINKATIRIVLKVMQRITLNYLYYNKSVVWGKLFHLSILSQVNDNNYRKTNKQIIVRSTIPFNAKLQDIYYEEYCRVFPNRKLDE